MKRDSVTALNSRINSEVGLYSSHAGQLLGALWLCHGLAGL
ncbi:MAG: hypothetical protein ACE5DW_05065 [Thermodesulfobacteriota bacterium]